MAVDATEARRIAEAELARMLEGSGVDARLDGDAAEHDFGWVFTYRAAGHDDDDPSTHLVGNAPLVVDRQGRLHRTGTAMPLNEYLSLMRASGELGPFGGSEPPEEPPLPAAHELDLLVAAVLAELEPVLVEGLSEDDAAWALQAYEAAVVPYRVAAGATGDDEETVGRVAADLVAPLAGLAGEEKWAAVVESYFASLVDEVRERASLLAADGVTDELETALEAFETHERAQAIAEELARSAPHLREAFLPALEAAVVDAEAALGAA